MSGDSDHQPFLEHIFANPGDENGLLVYADWLEEQSDARANYLRRQVQYRKSKTPALRQQIIEAYPYRHLGWTAALEQIGVVEANLSKYQFAWWGTDISPARKAGGTYEMFRFEDQPPLPTESLNGNFDWLKSSELQEASNLGPAWNEFCRDTRSRGFFVPDEFERFMTDPELPARIKSCTNNYFKEPEKRETVEWDDGLFVTFFADSQYCVLWGILLPREPGKYAPILSGAPESLFPGLWEVDDEDEKIEPVLVATQLEGFLYRYWIENEIWYATVWDESRRELTPGEQSYIDHLSRVYRDKS